MIFLFLPEHDSWIGVDVVEGEPLSQLAHHGGESHGFFVGHVPAKQNCCNLRQEELLHTNIISITSLSSKPYTGGKSVDGSKIGPQVELRVFL